MRKAQKEELVAEFEELLREARHFVISGYRGFDV